MVHGQAMNMPEKTKTVDTEIAQITGRSVGVLHIYGYADDCQLQVTGIQYVRHSFGHIGPVRVDYMGEVMPLIRLHEPALYDRFNNPIGKRQQTIYGGDIAPAGARLLLFPRARLRPYFTGAGGVAYFSSPILSPQATRLNFSAEFGTGFQYRVNDRMQMRAGYSVFHLSNGNTGSHNPALDTNFIYVAMIFKQKPIWRLW